ncbi:alpha-L-rhamnosidase C-terminal domain-containing protein [Micromonospora sp. ZYX-F-536]|uniref:alpha-L-rhamnosidase C-terminal domain-containing protein n=1 Tax=Micromonospora sp. ZYX-F-536 TaxID=3457629 RepID=UPI00404070A1
MAGPRAGCSAVASRPRPSCPRCTGPAAVAWRADAGTFALDVPVPVNTIAEVWVPDADPADVPEGGVAASGADGVRGDHRADDGLAVFTVGSGTYRFRRV